MRLNTCSVYTTYAYCMKQVFIVSDNIAAPIRLERGGEKKLVCPGLLGTWSTAQRGGKKNFQHKSVGKRKTEQQLNQSHSCHGNRQPPSIISLSLFRSLAHSSSSASYFLLCLSYPLHLSASVAVFFAPAFPVSLSAIFPFSLPQPVFCPLASISLSQSFSIAPLPGFCLLVVSLDQFNSIRVLAWMERK